MSMSSSKRPHLYRQTSAPAMSMVLRALDNRFISIIYYVILNACHTLIQHIVISKNRRCDGYSDCEDGSDELDCHGLFSLSDHLNFHNPLECQTTLSCPASDEPEGRKLCLSGSHLCDHLKHCPNGEDEDETLYCRKWILLMQGSGPEFWVKVETAAKKQGSIFGLSPSLGGRRVSLEPSLY